MTHLRTAHHNGVASLEIARPEKKNALTQAMYSALAEAIAGAQADHQVRALLLYGQPGIFCAGNDLEDFLQRPPQDSAAPVFAFMRALAGCSKPVVVAVTGAAIGIGCTMLLHADFVYISDEARLAMPFVSLGLVPEFASSLLAVQRMGWPRAAERLLLGEPFTAAQAVESGLGQAVLPAAEVLPHARRVAERFNTLPPEAVRLSKQLMRAPQRAAVEQAIADEAALFSQRLRSAEAQEALQAFFQQRRPDFSRF